ncbi:MAG: DNA-binding response regulator [Flavobacteriaceae bacterium]|nr:DNA-binding response regulator [Flavobacteriaceae bacterium]|tara:strand:- start:5189 stop:5884 length:696 start_codon:yes stop_codon:yes gene_type:complete
MSYKKNILLVEDDHNFGSILNDYLKLHSYKTTLARNGVEGLDKFKKQTYDMCILDVMMPFKDGFTLAEEIRVIDDQVPLIFLTAKSLKDDMIRGFKIGADDYLVKPFDSEVLLLKIKSIFRRKFIENSKKESKIEYTFSDFTFNSKLRTLQFREEDEITLSPKESKLLNLLLENLNDLTSREEALVKIWNDDNYFTSRSMDVYVTKIRKYLKSDPNISIENIHGKGFKMNV